MTRFALVAVAVALGSALSGAADEKIRVACVGDSITAGAGVENPKENAYPVVLQKLLGDGYEVKNFGVSGRTLLNTGDYPYTKEKAYQNALAFKPQIVIIKLGTNDTKPQNWKHEADFEKDYTALIESFQKLESTPRVFLCTPVPAYKGNFGITEPVVVKVKPRVEALGKKLELPVIDLYTALSDKKEMFPDQIHPNAAGAKLMAETIAAAVKADKK